MEFILLFYFILILFQLRNFFLNSIPININFILQTIKLGIPSFGNILFFYNTFKCILSNFFVCIFVVVALNCSSYTSFEIL
jgi:hypothetical protein